MVTFSASSTAILPLAGEAEVIRGFAADVVVAEVVVETLSVGKRSRALFPSAWERVGGRGLRSGGSRRVRWTVGAWRWGGRRGRGGELSGRGGL